MNFSTLISETFTHLPDFHVHVDFFQGPHALPHLLLLVVWAPNAHAERDAVYYRHAGIRDGPAGK